MPFAYYRRLSRARQRTYRKSDGIPKVALPDPATLRPSARAIAELLAEDRRRSLQSACQTLIDGINRQLEAPPASVRVLARRPSRSWGELHGLYEPADGERPARLTVWMRTAQRRQVVAYRTFLRTLLHELCHHLDYEHLGLAESFHTEGFFQRESSLFRQLAG